MKKTLNSFTSGELTPLLDGRADLDHYAKGLKTQRNMITLPYGGVTRRPGSEFVAPAASTSGNVKLIPFVFSKTQAYVLEFTALAMNVFYNDGTDNIKASGGSLPLATPYAEIDIPRLQYTQSADTLYIAHPKYAPRKITRTGHTSWTISVINFYGSSWVNREVNTRTMTPSEKVGINIQITDSGSGFNSGDLLRCIEITHADVTGVAYITGYNSPSVVTATVFKPFGDVIASTYWRITSSSGIFANSSKYPTSVAFYEDRLVFGGNDTLPQDIWGSVSGDYEKFIFGADDDDAIWYGLASNEVNVIRFLSSGKALHIGTEGGIFVLTGANASDAVTPTNVRIQKQSAYGCVNTMALPHGEGILYIQRNGRKLRKLGYQFNQDVFTAEDLTILAEHLLSPVNGLVNIAFQLEPYGIVWGYTSDGTLLGFTLNKEQNVVAWHKHRLNTIVGGSFGVTALAIIPSDTSEGDQVWVNVKRKINSVNVNHIEVMSEIDIHNADLNVMAFMDSWAIGTPTTNGTVKGGLGHLEGETVVVRDVNGLVQASKVVSGGSITLDTATTIAYIGLQSDAIIETMQLEHVQQGASIGELKRLPKLTVRFYRSVDAKVGTDSADLEALDFTAGTLFTGDKKLTLRGGFDTNRRIYVIQDKPLPMTILGLFAEFHGKGGK